MEIRSPILSTGSIEKVNACVLTNLCCIQVADFGLAKFASDNNTHVSTRVMGTFG